MSVKDGPIAVSFVNTLRGLVNCNPGPSKETTPGPGSLRHLPPSGGGLPRPSGLPQAGVLAREEKFR